VIGVIAFVVLVTLGIWLGRKYYRKRQASKPFVAEAMGEEVVEKDGFPHWKVNTENLGKKGQVDPAELQSPEDELAARHEQISELP
jgi:hypothetical protein